MLSMLKDSVKEMAHELGFAAVGVTTSAPVDELEHLTRYIGDGRNASMGWLARNPSGRCDPGSLLPGARSVICCALAYGERGFEPFDEDRQNPNRARYSRGANYHDAILAKLVELWSAIERDHLRAKAKMCVDTSPILEKTLAQRAGIGWIGKHTILVNEKLGSWFMLGEIITDLDMEPDSAAKNRCGSCDACVKACPTKALIAPNTLDARRCISFCTTELKGEPSADVLKYISDDTFGCDICQEACPYNKNG